MRTLSSRSYFMLVLGLSGWSLACGDGATEPTLPADPATLERAVLGILYEATGGDDWTRSDNWLSAAPLGEWYGVTVGLDGRVTRLRLPNNDLSGRIPSELTSRLSALQRLWLYSNDLTGPIPPELGDLTSLELLRIESNVLTGSVPAEIGQLTALTVLALSNNSELSGRLPSNFTALRALEELLAGGTDLCAPSDADFVVWLAGIQKLRLARCDAETGSAAYLTQAVQSREFPVPLLAGEAAPRWISDYHFTNALAFRLRDEVDDGTSAPPAPARSLLLWGGVDARGVPYLEPAFVTDSPPALPDSLGDYQLTGLTLGGREIFSLSFTMPEVTDGDGSSSFVFALPVQPGWAGTLAAVTLSGPGGMAMLDGDTDRPMVILRDPQTGQVRGMLRGVRPGELPRASPAADQTPGAVPGVVSSRGIPDAYAWRP